MPALTCNYILHYRLYRGYQKLYASMHDEEIGPHKTQFRRDENHGKNFTLLHLSLVIDGFNFLLFC